MAGEHFTITQDDEARLKQEAEQLERDIARTQRRLELVRRSLEAIGVLKALKGLNTVSLSGTATSCTSLEGDLTVGRDQGEEEPLISAILRVVAKSKSGLLPSEIKKTLISEGIREERLGNYFYSAISRLKARKELIVSQKRYRIAQKPEASNEDQSSEASNRERPNQPLNILPLYEGR